MVVFSLAFWRKVPRLQARWVKMGLEAANDGQGWGVNDLGGTLMEENISRLAGSYHGVRLDPPELIAAAHAAGRPAAERTTLYEIRREYPVPVAALARGPRGRLRGRRRADDRLQRDLRPPLAYLAGDRRVLPLRL